MEEKHPISIFDFQGAKGREKEQGQKCRFKNFGRTQQAKQGPHNPIRPSRGAMAHSHSLDAPHMCFGALSLRCHPFPCHHLCFGLKTHKYNLTEFSLRHMKAGT
jgi:hypothetical protein